VVQGVVRTPAAAGLNMVVDSKAAARRLAVHVDRVVGTERTLEMPSEECYRLGDIDA